MKAKVPVKGMAHITGGGITENIPRVLPAGLTAEIKKGSWPMPLLFTWLQAQGNREQASANRPTLSGPALRRTHDRYLRSEPDPWDVNIIVAGS